MQKLNQTASIFYDFDLINFGGFYLNNYFIQKFQLVFLSFKLNYIKKFINKNM